MLKLKYSNFTFECGTDEAGRGCLSGPVTAAAVILPNNFKHEVLNDSKQLSEKMRNELRADIEAQALTYSVAHVFPEEIDKMNILNASILAMHKAILGLKHVSDFIIVDGNKFKPLNNIPYKTIVKGDSKYLSIAAASVLAKTYRDAYMAEIHEEFPFFNWKKNKGYPTKEHRLAIQNHGITKYHRKSFRLLPQQLKIEF
ncbi:ribonuclease HII [Mangrovimonas yunxiaonensis]|uniref:Ribonuclease HII n=1 Tax=Mangrovimonas yunxiaonensis TaxID=1197477 RepID=A0A084TIH6_9FLAO|nr:ribonuclease HII [Mangrovimonas yunxiaonensis]KFB00512.1 ribonuclease HII [Mangrovimonas yunxiaonensis]GGH34276.1 ribonuclease HII [Mangrovimonas yunxiaonensis]